ncbi:hypothetical protein SELMODRAFT_420004 [Selaginella moellendorffii]|uniref:Uncharacterized protein n=1 Tax=Selaginella moellendorffii TaxID=88036 RepID=D8SA90_SELML|nr:hypothetical protein SELMODRAFT_420004 [Selaginella moellendorffii]
MVLQLEQLDTWTIVDGASIYIESPGPILQCVSDVKSNHHEFAKQGIYVYMEPWTLQDCDDGGKAVGLNITDMRDRYPYCGGVPRYIFFSDTSRLKSLINDAFANIETNNTNASERVHISKMIKARLENQVPRDNDHNSIHTRISSGSLDWPSCRSSRLSTIAKTIAFFDLSWKKMKHSSKQGEINEPPWFNGLKEWKFRVPGYGEAEHWRYHAPPGERNAFLRSLEYCGLRSSEYAACPPALDENWELRQYWRKKTHNFTRSTLRRETRLSYGCSCFSIQQFIEIRCVVGNIARLQAIDLSSRAARYADSEEWCEVRVTSLEANSALVCFSVYTRTWTRCYLRRSFDNVLTSHCRAFSTLSYDMVFPTQLGVSRAIPIIREGPEAAEHGDWELMSSDQIEGSIDLFL